MENKYREIFANATIPFMAGPRTIQVAVQDQKLRDELIRCLETYTVFDIGNLKQCCIQDYYAATRTFNIQVDRVAGVGGFHRLVLDPKANTIGAKRPEFMTLDEFARLSEDDVMRGPKGPCTRIMMDGVTLALFVSQKRASRHFIMDIEQNAKYGVLGRFRSIHVFTPDVSGCSTGRVALEFAHGK